MHPGAPQALTVKEVGVEVRVFNTTPISSPTKKRKAKEDDSLSPKREKTQKTGSKTYETSDREQAITQIAYYMPSVTESSKVKILWKEAGGNYRSAKQIVFAETRTQTEVEHEALQRHDAFQEQAYAARNRMYITYIARKRIKHLLAINKPSEFLFCAMEFQPLDVLRPTLARDVKAQDAKEIAAFLQRRYSIANESFLTNRCHVFSFVLLYS
ncbi:hypothetical protein EDB82DRAFT_552148 [Fusarium venenatum]|uniref:uncharacterized protein n=1 Tax=Fusarium venenatum TaxID=56646 RepID=UPI001E116102|nr:hypothetical protein EDB82DRAFT_552148 [Fusarium venenatum]